MVGIIIVNYKSEKETVLFVKTQLLKLDGKFTIVIINNSANELTNDYLKENLRGKIVYDISDNTTRDVGGIYIINSKTNLGFAKANNLGALFLKEHFNTDYYLFVNNDIEFCSTKIIESLTSVLNKDKNIGVVGPKVLNTNGDAQSPHRYISFEAKYFYRMFGFTLPQRKRFEYFSDLVENAREGVYYRGMGSILMAEAKAFYDCGMFDGDTFLYSEETILAERMRSMGKQFYYYPNEVVIHAHSQTIGAFYDDFGIQKMQIESDILYYSKYKNYSRFFLLVITELFKLFYYLLIKLRKQE